MKIQGRQKQGHQRKLYLLSSTAAVTSKHNLTPSQINKKPYTTGLLTLIPSNQFIMFIIDTKLQVILKK